MTKHAIEACKHSTHSTAAVGAAIFKNGKLISVGFNQDKGHPLMTRYGKPVGYHAEFAAITRLKNKNLLRGATIVVYRELRDGRIAMARPCELCMPLLIANGVKRMIYSTPEGFKEERL